MKSWLSCLLFLCSQPFLHGQEIRVLNKVTLEPVVGATLKNARTGNVYSSNNIGRVMLGNINPGDTLLVSTLGYEPIRIPAAELSNLQFIVYLKENTYTLEELVISSSRFDEEQKDIPRRIVAINSRQIQYMNQPTTADLLQQSGHVFVQKSQLGGGSPVIRGFEANKVLLVVDGIRMNNAIYRGGHLQNVITLDNAILDRAELIFGPGTVVYGSDALGGVMHFVTKEPMPVDSGVKSTGSAYLRYSTALNERTGHLDFSLSGKRFGSLSSVTFSDFDHLRTGHIRQEKYGDWGKRLWYVSNIDGKDSIIQNPDPNQQIQSAYSQLDVLQKFLFRQSNRISHVVNLQLSNSSNVPRYDRLTQTRNGLPRFAEWYYGPQTRMLAAYQLRINDLGFADLGRVTLNHQQISETRYSRQFNKPGLQAQEEQVLVYGLSADFTKKLNKHEFRYGLEANMNEVKSKGSITDIYNRSVSPGISRYPSGGSGMDFYAAYLSHSIEWNEKWIAQSGIRYTQTMLNAAFTDTMFFAFPFTSINQNNAALNGTAGISFLPDTESKISLAISSGFRAPNVDDLSKVFESVPGNLIVPNPSLKPEYTYTAELNYAGTISDRLHLHAGAFYTLYQQAITTQPGNYKGLDSIVFEGVNSRITQPVNASEAYVYGFNSSLQIEFTESIGLEASINYTYGRIQTDTLPYPLDHIPPIFGRTSIKYQRKGIRAEVFSMFNGTKKLADYNLVGEDNISYATSDGMPAWYTLNVRGSWAINRHWRIQLALENILDTHYRLFASNISAPGRNLIGSLHYSF